MSCHYDDIYINYPYNMKFSPYYMMNNPFNMGYREDFDYYSRAKQAPPTSPPPNFTPKQSESKSSNTKAIDQGAIAPCTFRFSYIWPKKGNSFWAFLIYVGKKSVAGWKFMRGRWVYFGMDLKEIKSFTCY